MDFISTRGRAEPVTAARAILRGLAPDGGLYLPREIPAFSLEEVRTLTALPYPELAAEVLARFLPGFTREELSGFTKDAYASFDDPAVAPLRPLEDGLWALELHHGPTSAFKDFALQLLPRLLSASVRKCGEGDTVAILVATSGDTGKAALAGFADVPGTKIAVFYPDGGVSDIQRAQMVTQEGANVLVLGVKGNFDDAQTGVKAIFSDRELEGELKEAGIVLSSANSINWGRLAPQIAYYFSAYAQLLAAGAVSFGEEIDFSVPTGNFGDILAGYMAKKAGLPVRRLICASNSNNVLTDFFDSGAYDKNRPFLRTMSPSMDILVSSNLERLLFLASGDPDRVALWMEELRSGGHYSISEGMLEKLRREGFCGRYADEAETARTIRSLWEERRYLADPHTAVGVSAAWRERADGVPCVVLSTASPFKFAADMLRSLGREAPESGFDAQNELAALTGQTVPAPLAALKGKPERFTTAVDRGEMRGSIRSWLIEQ